MRLHRPGPEPVRRHHQICRPFLVRRTVRRRSPATGARVLHGHGPADLLGGKNMQPATLARSEWTPQFLHCDIGPITGNVLIVAEIGINHNGDLNLAKQLIDVARRAGCDAVKFQKRSVELVYSKEILDSPRLSPWGTTTRDQKYGLEFGPAEYEEIDAYCNAAGLPWFASAWDVPSQLFLRQFDLPYNKIASAMLRHEPLLRTVAEERKMTFVSTGMSTLPEIELAVNVFREHACPFVLMHTVSEYPAAESSINLKLLSVLRSRYGCPVGYSGHETGIGAAVLAAAFGAVAIERHITLDRTMYGSDQAASLEESELQSLVKQVRALPVLIGSGTKSVTPVEATNAAKLRYYVAQGC
jgi:N-acetylneuraminate synthase